MRWVAAWFILAGAVALIIGLVQLQGSHDAWIVPTFCLIAAVAVLTGIGLLVGWPGARALGLLLSLGGILSGLVVLFAFVPILDVVSGGWLVMSPVILWIGLFVACAWALGRSFRGQSATG
jgi:hypothetical protein